MRRLLCLLAKIITHTINRHACQYAAMRYLSLVIVLIDSSFAYL